MKEIFKNFIEKLEGEQLTEFTTALDAAEQHYNETIANDYVSKEEFNKLALSYNKLNDDYKTRFVEGLGEHIEDDPEPEQTINLKEEYSIDNLFE